MIDEEDLGRAELRKEVFKHKPENCNERLLKMITNGAAEDTIMKSIEDLRLMTLEVEKMTSNKCYTRSAI